MISGLLLDLHNLIYSFGNFSVCCPNGWAMTNLFSLITAYNQQVFLSMIKEILAQIEIERENERAVKWEKQINKQKNLVMWSAALMFFWFANANDSRCYWSLSLFIARFHSYWRFQRWPAAVHQPKQNQICCVRWHTFADFFFVFVSTSSENSVQRWRRLTYTPPLSRRDDPTTPWPKTCDYVRCERASLLCLCVWVMTVRR